MTIHFYSNLSEPNCVAKTIVEALVLEGKLRAESQVTNPDILIETSALDPVVNYAYIPDFSRYYYISELTSIRSNLWRVSLTVDVLMSFATGIRGTQSIIQETERVSAGGNRYLTNDAFVTQVKRKTDIIQFPQGFGNDPYYILITAGGVPQ